MAVHPNAVADVKQDIYDTIASDGNVVTLMGNLVRGDQPPVDYLYDGTSTLADNYPAVIKPTLQTGTGRYIRVLFDQYQADWNQVITTAPDYIKGKPATGKRQVTYNGTTDSSGNYTVTYSPAFAAKPNVQPALGVGATNKEGFILTASSASGFTINVQARADVLGLLPSYSNVNGRSIDVFVTE